MRISDWSSDVCSSDLHIELIVAQCRVFDDESFEELAESAKIILDLQAEINVFEMELRIIERHQLISAVGEKTDPILCPFQVHQTSLHFGMSSPRSEEHTSELQSLMRISYAVFCLKQKKK